jgi:hypothetical protein
MRAAIQSVNEEDDLGNWFSNSDSGKGRKTEVDSSELTVNETDGGLRINASCRVTDSDGSLSGNAIVYIRRLILDFTEADLLKIIESPVTVKLIASNSPEKSKIEKAKMHLEAAMKALEK